MLTFSFIVVLQGLASIFGLVTIVVLCRQQPSFYQKITSITAVCSFIGIISYLLEILATNLEEALLAARCGYIGKSYAMVLFLIFIANYCDFRLPRWVVNSLMAFSTLILFLVLSCPYHKLYYTSVEFVDSGLFPHLVLGKGIFYYAFMIVTLVVMFLFMTISVTTLFKRKGEERRRLILLSLSGLLPAIGLSLNLFSFMQGFDPTPIGILAACCLVIYNVLRYGLLDTMQLASENVMDDTAAGLIVVSNTKTFVYANKAAYRIFPELKNDRESKELLDTIFENVTNDDIENKVMHRNNIIYELNYSVLRENSQIKEEHNNGYMVWVFDKTKDYNHTKELERLRIKAEEANRSKSIFLAKMSHEIRTPMNGIMGFADLALAKSLDSETEEYLRYIKDSANSLLGIINDVLDISKIESGKMEIIDVEYSPAKLLKEIIAMFKNRIEEKGLEFDVKQPEQLPAILVGDNNRIREILVNILGNALKYTNKGKITLDVSCGVIDEKQVELTIKVKDTGVGIERDKLADIFNAFEQADSFGNYYVEGTGLGLSIAKELCELMGGNISVSSVYGEGSEFTINVPQKRIPEKKNVVIAGYETDDFMLCTNDSKVLIVDDNIINLKVEKGMLLRYGMEIDLCESGAQCLEMIQNEKYDVIFMDHMMPGMDGVETLKAIRDGQSCNVNTPVILVTANAIVGVEQQMRECGFDGFISKPIDGKMLEKELLKVFPSEKLHVKSK